jgi:hypothetical protein
MSDSSEAVLEALSEKGLLLLQDKALPNVVSLVTGETLRTSWWGHAKGRLVFAVLTAMEAHPDVLFTRLLKGKVTLVHRALWPALLAIASAGEPWQADGLSEAASGLLASVNASPDPIAATGPIVKELESRLLVHAEEVHGEMGRHEVMVQPWSRWAGRAGVKPLRSVPAAKRRIEEAAEAIGARLTLLPWRAAPAR